MKNIAILLFLFGFPLAGCNQKCRSTCDKLYDECNLQRPGKSQVELNDECTEYCMEAMRTGGELDGYNPYGRSGATNSVSLENREQASLWMECVEETSCSRLDYRSGEGGYCQPVW
jgi:hypothetical protein